MTAAPLPHRRHVNRRVGIVGLIALTVLLIGLLQAGALRDLFTAHVEIRVLLPESGLAGLARGASVELLGTPAGRVDRVVVNPDERFHAVVELDADMQSFVRKDSVAYIRKTFGIAGASYLEITRGHGAPLDWDFAVIEAQAERAPTESLGELLEETRLKIFPVIEDTNRAVTAMADLVETLGDPEGDLRTGLADLSHVSRMTAEGQGSLGRLMTDDTLARELETTAARINANMDAVDAMVRNLERASADLTALTGPLSTQADTLPRLVNRTDETLKTLNTLLSSLDDAMPAVRDTLDNAATASASAPALLVQTRRTLTEMERLLTQARQSWLLGGGGSEPSRPATDAPPLSPLDVRP
jgi:phospholipid/cholesterol/gamma-HCH transport system substrate-binding protein